MSLCQNCLLESIVPGLCKQRNPLSIHMRAVQTQEDKEVEEILTRKEVEILIEDQVEGMLIPVLTKKEAEVMGEEITKAVVMGEEITKAVVMGEEITKRAVIITTDPRVTLKSEKAAETLPKS